MPTNPNLGVTSGISDPAPGARDRTDNADGNSIEQTKSSASDTGDNNVGSASKRVPSPLFVDTNVQAAAAVSPVDGVEQVDITKEKPVTWLSLPRKDQLLILTFARLSEPLTQTGLASYMVYQLQSFDPELSDSTIAFQASMIHAAFPAAQFLTAMLWGRFADSENGGRKRVIWIGLLGTMCSMVGFGFSRSFEVAVVFRLLGGMLSMCILITG